MTGPSTADIARAFREEYGRAIAVLTRVLGDLDAAEDAVQDAFSIAVERWPGEGIPPSPAGWIITTARRRAIDRARREAARPVKHAEADLLYPTSGDAFDSGAVVPPELVDTDLCSEAVRLARVLAGLVPDDPETTGLLALMLLGESRRSARTGPGGELVLLADQDRSRWDRALIAEGQALVRRTLRWNGPGPYQIQAAIAAVHADAPTFEDTDWAQIVALYDLLFAADPTPVVALHRAVALAEVEGPAAALGIVDHLDLERYHVFHVVRADLLARLGRLTEASEAYATAAARTENAIERAHLLRRRDEVRDALR
ncbi:hypothetical protein MX572_10420 [Rhodococcus pyridinivorans]|uniref:RNA polymerase sigma factor n=1 Tax=Rhodococcus pyridinivorans TaxID=103816 RepID=UPI0020C69174|nr:DUF6596 domain-containing protein [Rhodococcus pyridinivorans]UTM39105.1 hypothetical protein MX572_10420 [Rhodococcus pyridinivorans]